LVSITQEPIDFAIGGQIQSINTGVGSALFEKLTIPQITSTGNPLGQASLSSCLVTSFVSSTPAPGTNPPDPIPVPTATGLDAGAAISITAASGNAVTLPQQASSGKGIYAGADTTISFQPGVYKLSNGAGGADIGAFSANINVPATLRWSNRAAVTGVPINRAQPLQVTWTGGEPGSYAFIEGFSTSTTTSTTAIATFVCTAPISAGQFTIPPPVLLSLPPSSSAPGFSTSFMLLGTSSNPQSFTARGLDLGYFIATSATGAQVSFQ
jgi:hypothetical protein